MTRKYLIAVVVIIAVAVLMASALAEVSTSRNVTTPAPCGMGANAPGGGCGGCGMVAATAPPRCGVAGRQTNAARPGMGARHGAGTCGAAAPCAGCEMAGKPHKHGDNEMCASCDAEDCEDCPMAAAGGSCGHHDAQGKPGKGMHHGENRPGVEVARAITGGQIHLKHHLQQRADGALIAEVAVVDDAGKLVSDADVSGYVYPVGDVSAGRGVAFAATCRGPLMGWVKAPDGELELALRVKRAGMDDEVLYFGLAPAPAPQPMRGGCPMSQ